MRGIYQRHRSSIRLLAFVVVGGFAMQLVALNVGNQVRGQLVERCDSGGNVLREAVRKGFSANIENRSAQADAETDPEEAVLDATEALKLRAVRRTIPPTDCSAEIPKPELRVIP